MLFEQEVPEIYEGQVRVIAVARDPGNRAKVAVKATEEGIDPIGTCVGVKGIRVQTITSELDGERIDVLEWNEDPSVFIAKALGNVNVRRVELNEEDQSARVIVPDNELSLAIGQRGQNARLAAKLTGWKVDIKGESEATVSIDELFKPVKEDSPDATEDAQEEADTDSIETEVAETPLEDVPIVDFDEETETETDDAAEIDDFDDES